MLEILVTLGIVALALLIFFIIQTLITVQTTLKKLDGVLIETESKLRKLDSFMNTLENISNITEKESEIIKNNYEYNRCVNSSRDSDELAKWLISSIKLGINFLTKR